MYRVMLIVMKASILIKDVGFGDFPRFSMSLSLIFDDSRNAALPLVAYKLKNVGSDIVNQYQRYLSSVC